MSMSMRDEFARGWRTLVASSLGYGSGVGGLAYFTLGIFVLPLSEAFGWSRGQVSLGSTALIAGTAITGPIVGGIIDRIGAYRIALASFALLVVGYGLLTQLNGSILWFLVGWSLMSLAGGGTTPVVWTRAVNLWFDRGRGLALGLCLAGSGIAGIIGPPLTNLIIKQYGWQGGYAFLGLFILLISIPLIAWLYEDRPPLASAAGADTAATAAAVPGLEPQEALRSLAFWKIALGFVFVSGVIAGLIVHLTPLLVSHGMTRDAAATYPIILGIAIVFGRICIGWLLDRMSAPRIAATLLVICALGCYLMTLEQAPLSATLLYIIALGFGAAAEVDLVAYLTSRYLGMRAYGRIYGYQITIFYIGAATGPSAIGFSFDRYQSYTPALYVAVAALVFGAAVLATLGRPPNFGANSSQH